MTYYQQLQIPPEASVQQIKEAYRRMAFEYHPDRNKDDPAAAEKMKALSEVGIHVCKSPADIGKTVKEVLGR